MKSIWAKTTKKQTPSLEHGEQTEEMTEVSYEMVGSNWMRIGDELFEVRC